MEAVSSCVLAQCKAGRVAVLTVWCSRLTDTAVFPVRLDSIICHVSWENVDILVVNLSEVY